MERSSVDQAVELLTRSARGILLAVPTELSTDALASMVGLSLALEKMGKNTFMVSPSFVPEPMQFLPGTSQVHERLETVPALRLSVPVGRARPTDVQWELTGETLNIVVRSDGRVPFPTAEIRVDRHGYPWDTIVTVGVDRLHALGTAFTEHTQFFYDTPIVNMDRGTLNEFFGTVNLVSATASTLAETVLELLEALGGVNLLGRDVTTCLLTGVVAGSRSFRAPGTTPRTFHAASRLLEQDADHQQIIRHLFKVHSSGELHLLGRALARLEDIGRGVLCAVLTQRDFSALAMTPDATPAILQDILEWAGSVRPVLLGLERTPNAVEILIAPGRMSREDREALRDTLTGVVAGPFVLVNLGTMDPKEARRAAAERILPHLIREPEPAAVSAPSRP